MGHLLTGEGQLANHMIVFYFFTSSVFIIIWNFKRLLLHFYAHFCFLIDNFWLLIEINYFGTLVFDFWFMLPLMWIWSQSNITVCWLTLFCPFIFWSIKNFFLLFPFLYFELSSQNPMCCWLALWLKFFWLFLENIF